VALIQSDNARVQADTSV